MNDSHEAEIDFEPEEDLGDIGAAQAKLKKLKDELEKVKAERQEYLDGWQRCKADSINARKEALAAADRGAERKLEALAHDILPALDSFHMASQSETWADVADGFRNGMEHVQSQLLEALRRSGIERYGKVGDQFDHALHETVEERDDVAGESGTITRIVRHGFRMGERILRPAQVITKS